MIGHLNSERKYTEHCYLTGPLFLVGTLESAKIQKDRPSITSHVLSQKFIQLLLLDYKYGGVCNWWDQEVVYFKL